MNTVSVGCIFVAKELDAKTLPIKFAEFALLLGLFLAMLVSAPEAVEGEGGKGGAGPASDGAGGACLIPALSWALEIASAKAIPSGELGATMACTLCQYFKASE